MDIKSIDFVNPKFPLDIIRYHKNFFGEGRFTKYHSEKSHLYGTNGMNDVEKLLSNHNYQLIDAGNDTLGDFIAIKNDIRGDMEKFEYLSQNRSDDRGEGGLKSDTIDNLEPGNININLQDIYHAIDDLKKNSQITDNGYQQLCQQLLVTSTFLDSDVQNLNNIKNKLDTARQMLGENGLVLDEVVNSFNLASQWNYSSLNAISKKNIAVEINNNTENKSVTEGYKMNIPDGRGIVNFTPDEESSPQISTDGTLIWNFDQDGLINSEE